MVASSHPTLFAAAGNDSQATQRNYRSARLAVAHCRTEHSGGSCRVQPISETSPASSSVSRSLEVESLFQTAAGCVARRRRGRASQYPVVQESEPANGSHNAVFKLKQFHCSTSLCGEKSMNSKVRQLPLARKDVVVKELQDETMVLDSERNKVFCLNKTSAMIWKACDGRTSIAEMTKSLQTLDSSASDSVVWFALQQLESDGLLEESVPVPAAAKGMTRKELVKKLGLVAALVPVISVMSTPASARAFSGGGEPISNPNPLPDPGPWGGGGDPDGGHGKGSGGPWGPGKGRGGRGNGPTY